MNEKSELDILITLARLEEKLDHMRADLTKHTKTEEALHHDHEERVRALEQSKWTIHGFSAMIAATMAVIMNYLWKN